MNCVNLIGRLTKDPDIKYTQTNNTAIANFTLAVNRRFTKEGQPTADFINIVVWRNAADNCHKFLRKGSKAAVVGNLQTRSYDAQDGTKRYVTEVVAEEVEFVGSRVSDGGDTGNTDAGQGSNQGNQGATTKLTPIQDDSLPF